MTPGPQPQRSIVGHVGDDLERKALKNIGIPASSTTRLVKHTEFSQGFPCARMEGASIDDRIDRDFLTALHPKYTKRI